MEWRFNKQHPSSGFYNLHQFRKKGEFFRDFMDHIVCQDEIDVIRETDHLFSALMQSDADFELGSPDFLTNLCKHSRLEICRDYPT